MREFTSSIKLALVAAVCGLLVLTPAVLADHEDESDHGNDHDGNHAEYGAYIYDGTCDKISTTLIADIGDLEADQHVWPTLAAGTPSPGMVYGEDEDIRPSIDALISKDHVLVVRASDDQRAPVVACGEISGAVDSNGTLGIDLHEVNRSGIEGRAIFAPKRHDHDQTNVTTAVWRLAGGTPTITRSGSSVATATATAGP